MKLNEMLHVKREPISLSDDDKKKIGYTQKKHHQKFPYGSFALGYINEFSLINNKEDQKIYRNKQPRYTSNFVNLLSINSHRHHIIVKQFWISFMLHDTLRCDSQSLICRERERVRGERVRCLLEKHHFVCFTYFKSFVSLISMTFWRPRVSC